MAGHGGFDHQRQTMRIVTRLEERYPDFPGLNLTYEVRRNGAVISERMSRWCAEHSTAEALEILGKAKIPAGPVLKPQQTLDDPHIQAMGFFQPTEFPGAPRPAPLAKARGCRGRGSIDGRQLGEHRKILVGSAKRPAAAGGVGRGGRPTAPARRTPAREKRFRSVVVKP
jgi:crotonobetainyl-CoA:carnitine CoA-transferase CaiB-like acyl-CoA transferase